jgi:hypothetical protein
VLAIFWHFTTGEWRQYLPTGTKLGAMVRFYTVGIFKHEPHPVRKTRYAKLNPLQRLAYLGLKTLIFPVSIITGLLYLYFNDLAVIGLEGTNLEVIALIHTMAAYLLMAFHVRSCLPDDDGAFAAVEHSGHDHGLRGARGRGLGGGGGNGLSPWRRTRSGSPYADLSGGRRFSLCKGRIPCCHRGFTAP